MSGVFSYTTLNLPNNRTIQIPTVSAAHPEYEGRVKTPEWMVGMDQMLTSNVDTFTDYCELFGWYAKSSRMTSADIANNLFTSSSLHHSNVALIIPNGGYAANIELAMNTGKLISEIRILRLGNVGDMKVTLQQVSFFSCRIQTFEQQLDRLIVECHINTRENTIYVYDNSGQNTGQMVSQVDYVQNTTGSGGGGGGGG